MPGALYDVLLLCHLAVGFIGFGAVAVAGWAASVGRRRGSAGGDEWVLRFFSEKGGWPSRLVLLVPVFGLAMVFGGDRHAVGAAWPWAGLALWAVAIGHLLFIGWPAEARARGALSAGSEPERPEVDFATACGRLERASAVASLCFVVAVALMVWQP